MQTLDCPELTIYEVPNSEIDSDRMFIQEVARIIKKHARETRFDVKVLAEIVGYSRAQLSRKLTALIGVSPGRQILMVRLHMASVLLREGDASVKQVAWNCGFVSYQSFWKAFGTRYGCSPSAYRMCRNPSKQVCPSCVSWVTPPSPELRNSMLAIARGKPWLCTFLKLLLDHLGDESVVLDELAASLNLSSSQLIRNLKSCLGITPIRFLQQLRILYAAELLADETVSIATVAYRASFFDQAHFSHAFKGTYRCSPSVYKKQKRQENFCTWLKKELMLHDEM
ncbi:MULTISPECIES: helix-turn-helix transcriptional regulator [Reichenbachiella]|uniref:helix-turn-helix transcriptional regulator n=1 Tax=Reichenbachiella TaxID=156993 RepID=UPI000E6D3B31|nr:MULTISPECIES: helix-turn-helix domain-containing protein [Reichenbachiella]MBU2915700.1 helix-turn-helix domain-containing protein [Reichenbachiella agariperforans]RJE72033.1 hypothetical protein BGP76_08110 [Reichenbachiella sp. MSK19-1]